MRVGKFIARSLCGSALVAAACLSGTVHAQGLDAVGAPDSLHSGQLDVPVNKSQVLRVGRPFTKALIGSADIADILPLSNRALYVLGKKVGTTSLTLYDGTSLVGVVDVAVGPDVVSLRRQLQELMPNEKISARISNDSVILSGIVSSAPAAERAGAIAATFAPDKVVNMLSIGASQQVMLEVRFSEINRQAGKQIGLNHSFVSDNGRFGGSIGNLAGQSVVPTVNNGVPTIALSNLSETFGVGTSLFRIGSVQLFSALDALERKGLVKTLAEPTLVALSGESASFLAGGEFPIPVAQGNGGGTGGTGGNGITVEFKPFGVSLGFTPTVLDDGIINMVVQPEVSSIDSSASVTVNGLVVPGLQTRRAKTTVELRDGESFALAGLIRNDFSDTVRQFPVLGSIPILGSLFRSTGFQKNETELVIIVTPRLVKPMKAEQARLPTDRVKNPHELDLFLMGRTDQAVGINPLDPSQPHVRTPAKPGDKRTGVTGDTGHEF